MTANYLRNTVPVVVKSWDYLQFISLLTDIRFSVSEVIDARSFRTLSIFLAHKCQAKCYINHIFLKVSLMLPFSVQRKKITTKNLIKYYGLNLLYQFTLSLPGAKLVGIKLSEQYWENYIGSTQTNISQSWQSKVHFSPHTRNRNSLSHHSQLYRTVVEIKKERRFPYKYINPLMEGGKQEMKYELVQSSFLNILMYNITMEI